MSVLSRSYAGLWSEFAASTAGLVRTNPPIACAACDHFQTAKEAVATGLDRGYSRPALVIDPRLDELTDHRFSGGYYSAIRLLPAARKLPVHWSDQIDSAAFARWFARYNPDYIVTAHDTVLRWLRDLGASILELVGLAHLDWHPGISEWAGMKQNSLAVARRWSISW